MTNHKTCPKCKLQLPYNLFNKQSRSKDGLQTYCMQCLKAYRDGRKEQKAAVDKAYRIANSDRLKERSRKYYQENKCALAVKRRDYLARNREKFLASLAAYRRNNPEKIKRLRKEAYWRSPEKNRLLTKQWVEQNIQRVSEYKQEYRQKNLFAIRAKGREYIKENRDRLKFVYKANKAKRRAAGKMISAADIQDILRSQKYICVACRQNIRSKFHLDHIVPIALGGRNEKSNFQCLCPSCNLSKSKKHPIEFMQQRGYLL